MPQPDVHLRLRRSQNRAPCPQPMATGGPVALISGDRRGIAFALAEAWFDLAPDDLVGMVTTGDHQR